jgi:YegS/Rv2252/BmrU family lipid kinase
LSFTIPATICLSSFCFLCKNINLPRHLFFLLNPISGTKPKDALEKYLINRCRQAGFGYSIMHTTINTSAEMVRMQMTGEGATDLIAVGGDGTVNLAASAVAHSEILLGIIPVGSGNGLARSAGIPLNPAKAFDVILQGQYQLTDAFSINQHFGIMLSGIGFDAAVAKRFSHSRNRGLFTYTTQTLLEFFKASPYPFDIEVEGFQFSTEAFFISIANSNQFGNNVTIAPQASLCDGMLDVVVVQKMPKTVLPCALIKQLRHTQGFHKWKDSIGKKTILYFQTPQITIRNLRQAPLHIDGDPFPTKEKFEIEVVEKAVRLLVSDL